MRTIKIQTLIGGMTVYSQVINPAKNAENYCKAGSNRTGTKVIYDIINVPNNVPDNEVLRIFKLTCIWKPENFNYTFDYSQLGEGFLIMKRTT